MDAKNINGTIYVTEQDQNGIVKVKTEPATYSAYISDDFGTFRSITGQKLRRVTYKSRKLLQEAKEKFKDKRFWESDINPTYRFLEKRYPQDDQLPDLHISIYDIEVDRDPVHGYAPPDKPFCPIISVTVYHKWSDQAITLAVPPPGMSMQMARKLCADPLHEDDYGVLNEDSGYYLVEDEIQLLEVFVEIIQETDILAGWNCMPLSETVWLSDRITTIGDCAAGQLTHGNGIIKGKHQTGRKPVYEITTNIGSVIKCSGEHRIPVAFKSKKQYRNHNTISTNDGDVPASKLMQLIQDHDVFVNIVKHVNTNSDFDDIPDAHLRLLGLLFTDGSVGKDGASVYSSVDAVMSYYGSLIEQNNFGTGNWGTPFKDNSRARLRTKKLAPLLPFIYQDGRKVLNVPLLSKLSYKQFISFFCGIIDGDGSLCHGSLSVCNFEGQLHSLQELLLWNGVISTVKGNGTSLRISQDETNREFVEALTIVHPKRILDQFTTVARTSSNKDGALYSTDGNYWSKISIIETSIDAEMADIETQDHYFYSAGIKVHNSEFYDLPYIINRARHVIGGESLERISTEGNDFEPSERSTEYLERLSAFRALPDTSFVENYGRRERTYQIIGRRHVDYLMFYKKFIRKEGMFALDAILRDEVGQTKVKYDGSIDEFYRREFRRFLAYNRQDVMGLDAVDSKLRLINMANQMIHMSGVTMDKAVGSVAIIEQAVLRELHRERNEIAWDRTDHLADKHVPGAFVVEPRAGKYGWGGSYDVNSLYPTMIRLLNISPETMVGQLDLSRTTQKLNDDVDDILKIPLEDRIGDKSYRLKGRKEDGVNKAYTIAWQRFTGVLEYHDVIDGTSDIVKLVMPDNAITLTGKQMRDYIRNNNYCITANGTVFDLAKEGIIPFCLTKWYNERIEYQKNAKQFAEDAGKAKEAGDIDLAEKLLRQAEFYDMVQNAKKLFLNSTYGAYLNRFFRFYDAQCGRSVTLSGRVVVKHMCRKACELLIGKYDFDRDVLLGGDTDSTYISYEGYLRREGLEKTLENVTTIADRVGNQINDSFVSYLSEQFLVPPERCKIVQVKRETIFDRAIFKDKKKRYAMHVLDKEGKHVPKGHKNELKVIGLETRRSDTPKIMQDFLQECLRLVLVEGFEEEDLRVVVDEFRGNFRNLPQWKRGSPVRVRNLHASREALEKYNKALDDQDYRAEKPLIYYAVTAARNTNILMERFKEQRWEELKDGDKVDFLYLMPGNEFQMDAVAIRAGEEWVPDWFKKLPFDDRAHEVKLVDKKLENIFGGLGWEFAPRDHEGWSIFS